MKLILALILSLAGPLIGLADGLATSVCVLEKGQFDSLVKTTGDITKVANPLFPASGRLPAFSTAFTPKANS